MLIGVDDVIIFLKDIAKDRTSGEKGLSYL